MPPESAHLVSPINRDDVVREGSRRFNVLDHHPELVHKHPAHLVSPVTM